jgi:hypothetical protein
VEISYGCRLGPGAIQSFGSLKLHNFGIHRFLQQHTPNPPNFEVANSQRGAIRSFVTLALQNLTLQRFLPKNFPNPLNAELVNSWREVI